jgi:nucleoside-diphosphate-sugar epimerase
MRAFVTGGTGFIGGHLVRRLRDRGDEVAALVRTPQKGAGLRDLGCDLVEGDLGSDEAIRKGVAGCDSVFHAGGMYEVGVSKARCAEMHEANIGGTERVLDAAMEAGAARIVFVSTVNVFGNTRGEVVDEAYRRPLQDGFVSCYDETKWRSHEVALDRISRGAPVVIVQSGVVYGPGDHSEMGAQLAQAWNGSLPFVSFPRMGVNMAYVEDVAEGILLAHDKGRLGESYVLGGQITTMREAIAKVSALAGRKPPRITMPTLLMKMFVPLSPLAGGRMGIPRNLKEAIRAADGVTYWASDEKARRELGYTPRDLDAGLKEAYAAAAN